MAVLDPNPTFDVGHGDMQTLAGALTRIAEHPQPRARRGHAPELGEIGRDKAGRLIYWPRVTLSPR